MKKQFLAALLFGLVGLFGASSAMASTSWIDWTSTTTGTLDVGGSSVGVSLTGPVFNYENGDIYYNNGFTGGTSASGTYAGLAPSDLIRLYAGGLFTLTFDEAVLNPYMALISVGRTSLGVTYSFDNSFSVVSAGSNIWGYGGYSVAGNDFTGYEYNGVLQFTGSLKSISFAVDPAEYWHGFNFGVRNAAVPESSTLFLLSAGLLVLMLGRKKA